MDPTRFIREHLPVTALSTLGVRLHLAGPHSRVGWLAADGPAPYWAYAWAGGLALAHHLLAHPETVRGRRVLDFGAGSGLVGIVAGRLSAERIVAVEADAHGRAAIALNAALNGVELEVAAEAPPDAEVVLAGDVFYAPEVAGRSLAFLDLSLAAGAAVFVGDPGRVDLPSGRLRRLAAYDVADVGRAGPDRAAAVFVFERRAVSPPAQAPPSLPAGRSRSRLPRSAPRGRPPG